MENAFSVIVGLLVMLVISQGLAIKCYVEPPSLEELRSQTCSSTGQIVSLKSCVEEDSKACFTSYCFETDLLKRGCFKENPFGNDTCKTESGDFSKQLPWLPGIRGRAGHHECRTCFCNTDYCNGKPVYWRINEKKIMKEEDARRMYTEEAERMEQDADRLEKAVRMAEDEDEAYEFYHKRKPSHRGEEL